MTALTIIATIVGYIAMLFVVAWRSSRNVTQTTFFTGGRSTHRVVAAIAMVGAAMSGVTYISVPGTVAADGFSYLQTTLGFLVGYIIIAYLLIPLYYRLNVVSLYEYLDRRFGIVAHRTGAWFFFIAKMASASLRAYVVCVVLQQLLFARYDIPFAVNGAIMMLLVWLYTRRGGVRSVVWVEMLKTLIMVASIVLCIGFVMSALGMNISEAVGAIAESNYSDTLFLDDPLDRRYFWKQFLAGVFLVVAMTGLDQDMMQTVLSCREKGDAQRGLLTSIAIQIVVILLFLSLGALLYIYVAQRGDVVESGDELFGYVATECGLPTIVGIAFLLGLIASTYSSAGSALTALTTSFSIDILAMRRNSDSDDEAAQQRSTRTRRRVHTAMAVTMWLMILCFNRWSSSGVITLIFTMASYTYGPLLGMFAFGLMSRRRVRSMAIPIVAIASPTISYIIASHSEAWLGGYTFSYEVLILNGMLTLIGLWMASWRTEKESDIA
ncbi:MAG: sodium:solute symporter [Alistipes sp.]|nr:sodium:solute symporter [Alistipes sp.]